MSPLTGELEALYGTGQYETCLQATRQMFGRGVYDNDVIVLNAICLVRLGRGKEFAQMVRASGGDGILLTAWALSRLHREEAYAALAPLAAQFDSNDAPWLIAAYFSGCASLMRNQWHAAMAQFKAFRLAWPRFLGKIDLLNDDEFNVMLRQGRLVVDQEELERRMTVATRRPALTFVGDTANAAGRPVVFASGNNHYFNVMGAAFVEGMMPYLPTVPDRGEATLHVHVIDPDDESRSLIDALRAAHGDRLAFSLEAEPLFRTYTYYSCSRFYVMPELLDRYRAPVVSFDIDIVPTRPIVPLFEAAAPYDFCCVRTKRNEPASFYQASIMYWPDRPATRALLDGLQHFCWEELPNPSRVTWMLDQAGLFSLLANPESTIRFGDYAALIGRELLHGDGVRITFGDDVKAELRHRVSLGEPKGISGSGRALES